MARGRETGGVELGPRALAQLSEMWTDYEARRRVGGSGSGAAEPFTKFGPRVFRWAKCQANDLCSYPAKPANNFPIVFGELEVDTDSCGYQVRAFTPYDPEEARIAHDPYDIWREEGDVVAVYHAHGKWYILGGSERMWAEAYLDGNLCAKLNDDDEEQVVAVTGETYLPNCETFQADKVVNPRRHAGPDGAKVLMVRKQCNWNGQPDTEEWQIVDIELRKKCEVNGIEKRFNAGSTDTGAIVVGSVPTQAEWCPDEEPAEACELITFGPCTGTVTADDLSWEVLVGIDCCPEQ